LVLMVQQPEEPEVSFFERVKRRFEIFARDRKVIDRVVLVPGTRWGKPSLLARAQFIRKLVTLLVPRRDTQVLLDAGAHGGPSSLGMRAIASAISDTAASAFSHLRLVSGPPALAATA
jgi:hypothetical protein